MSTTTTLQVGLEGVKDHLTLVVKPKELQITALPPQLYQKWKDRYRLRNPRPLSDEELEKSLHSIALAATLKGLGNVRGLALLSTLTLSLPATDRHPEELIWRGRVVSISPTVTF